MFAVEEEGGLAMCVGGLSVGMFSNWSSSHRPAASPGYRQ
jgi:hypothetical protein